MGEKPSTALPLARAHEDRPCLYGHTCIANAIYVWVWVLPVHFEKMYGYGPNFEEVLPVQIVPNTHTIFPKGKPIERGIEPSKRPKRDAIPFKW